MRKIVLDLATTLDGFIEGPNGEVDWCIMDDDMSFDEFLDSVDTIFYGRVSYDAWGNFHPDAGSNLTELALWKAVHSKRKIVFSSREREDANAEFITADLITNVKKIQSQEGKDIWLYGGAKLIETFVKNNLIDTYRISVHPLALGKGKALFGDLTKVLPLKLVGTKTFKSGVVQLIYERAAKE